MLGCFKPGTRVTRNSDNLPGTVVEVANGNRQDEFGSYRAFYFVKLDYELSAGGCKLRGTTPLLHGGQFTVTSA